MKMALDMRGLQVGAPQHRETFNLHAADMNSQLCGWLFISMHYSLPVHINSTFLWANVVITRKWTRIALLGLQGWLGVLAFFLGGGNLVKNRTIFLKVFSSGSLSPIWLSSTTPLRGIFPAQHEPSMTLADVKGFFGSRYICLLVCDFSLGILGSFEKTNVVNFGKAEGSNQEQWRVHIVKISLKNSKGEEFFADLVFTSQRAVGNKQELQSHENPDEPDIKSTFVMWW